MNFNEDANDNCIPLHAKIPEQAITTIFIKNNVYKLNTPQIQNNIS